LMCARSNYGMTKVLGKIGVERVILVWSMWNGYWKRDGCALREWAEVQGTQVAFIHSGGHAWPNHLHTLAEVIGARQTVWVHTDAEALPTDELNST
jgi:hypothetical protein